MNLLHLEAADISKTDLDPNLKIVYFLGDKKFEHISSSAIRNLEQYGKHYKYIL